MNLPSGWFVFPSCPGHQDSHSTTWLSFFTLLTSGSPLSLQFPGPVLVCLSLAAFSLQLCTPCLSSISPGHFWLHLLSPKCRNVSLLPLDFLKSIALSGEVSSIHLHSHWPAEGKLSRSPILLMSSMIKISCPHPWPCSRDEHSPTAHSSPVLLEL